MTKHCAVPSCTANYYAKGYCSIHYHRWLRHGDPLKVLRQRPSLADDLGTRLAQYSDRSGGPNACWLFTGDLKPNGYGSFMFARKRDLAHRWAWKLAHDSIIPAGMVIRHKCDNPPCCNPKHLEIGTQEQNVADSYIRGRRRGRISAELVDAIRARKDDGVSMASVGREFGVGPTTVNAIWRDLRVSERLAIAAKAVTE